jgi:hypothetical protein
MLLASAASRDAGSGIGTLSDRGMPVSLMSTRATSADRAAPASSSDCRRSLHPSAAAKIAGSRFSAGPLAAVAIPILSLKIWPAETVTVRSISGAGKRQPRPSAVGPLIRLRDT